MILFVFLFVVVQSAHIKILHTTDIHGWVLGHKHQAEFNADLGDLLSLVEHLSEDEDGILLMDSGRVTTVGVISGTMQPIPSILEVVMLKFFQKIAS